MYCSAIPMGTRTSHLNHFARHWELNITINMLIMILVDVTTLPKDFTSQKPLKLCSLTQSRVSFFSLVHAVVVCLYIFFDLLEETKSSHTQPIVAISKIERQKATQKYCINTHHVIRAQRISKCKNNKTKWAKTTNPNPFYFENVNYF